MSENTRELQEILCELSSKQWENRFLSLQRLKGFPTGIVEDHILPLLKDRNENVRYMAVRILGEIKSVKSLPYLMKIIEEKSHVLRVQAVEALGKIKDVSCLSFLEKILKSEKNEIVKATVISVIGSIGSEAHIELIIEHLDDQDERVCANALEAIDRLGGKTDVILAQITKSRSSNRFLANAAKSVARHDRERAIKMLGDMLCGRDEWMRASACYAIGEIRECSMVDELVRLLSDQYFAVSRNAFEALQKLGTSIIPRLEYWLKTENTSGLNLKEIIRLLSVIGDQSTLGFVVPFLNHNSGEIREEARKAIDRIREKN